MKNIYSAVFKLNLALDSFIIMPSKDNDELVIYSHYISYSILQLRSGHYVFETPKSSMTALERKEIREGNKKRGKIFMPDIKNIVSNIKVKEQTTNSITISCDLYLANPEDIINLAFCEEWEQKYIAISPITKEARRTSGTSGEKKYYISFKQNNDSTIYEPFEF